MDKSRQDDIFLKAKIQDAVEWVMKTGQRKFLHFLDPAQQEMCTRLLKNKLEVKFDFFGGHIYCERKIICIHPKDDDLTMWEWPIATFHFKPKHYYKQLKHPDILGTLIHLGIRREKIGDINISNEFIQIFIAEELKGFIKYHLDAVSTVSINVEEVDWEHVVAFQPAFNELLITSASLRLDGIISRVYGLSRKESSYLIGSGKVKVNWQLTEKSSMMIMEKDVISVRGKGRALIYEVVGETKKGNKKILIHKFK